MEMAHDCIQCQSAVLTALDLWATVPERQVVQDENWTEVAEDRLQQGPC
jgi:hypothetical protein